MKRPVIFLCFFELFIILEIAAYQLITGKKNLQFVDSDCYMRMVRVEQLYTTHNWYDASIHRSNWPYGEKLHWSRLFDIILIAGALIGCPFVGFKAALFWWGMYIGPILNVASVAVLLWAAAPLFRQNSLLRLGLLFLGQAGIWCVYIMGRPDHHCLLLLLFCTLIGFCIRILDSRYSLLYSGYAGITAATALWVSIESLVAVVMLSGVLTVLWVWKAERFALKAGVFSLSLLIFSILYIFVEAPPRIAAAVVYDKLSIVHVVAFFLFTLFWAHTCRIKYNSSRLRTLAIFVFCCITGAVLHKYYSVFFQGPYAGIDPRIVPIWLSKVKEVHPLLQFSRHGITNLVLFLGPALLCVPYTIYLIVNRRNEFSKEWVMYSIGMVIYIPLALYQMRWAAYADVVMLFPMAVILEKCLLKLNTIGKKYLKTIAKFLVTAAFCTGFLIIGIILLPGGKAKLDLTATKATAFLNSPQMRFNPKTIIANVDFGPEILYRTPHRVVATPYHRNGAGITCVYDIMTAHTDSEAYKLLHQREANLILLVPESTEKVFYQNAMHSDTFYKRLLTGHYPVWLRPVKLPENLMEYMHLYEVLEVRS